MAAKSKPWKMVPCNVDEFDIRVRISDHPGRQHIYCDMEMRHFGRLLDKTGGQIARKDLEPAQ